MNILPRITMSASPGVCSFGTKIERFMERHVLPFFDPAEIQWWLSLSGGKDSFSMALGLRAWYEHYRKTFKATVFTIDQWGGPAAQAVQTQIPWTDVQVLDARLLTQSLTRYQPGEQAPCRECANARRHATDALIKSSSLNNDRINFIARGLHLSDTAVSLLWRYIMGRDPANDFLQAGKGRPVVKLWYDTYLVKPLAYAREYESQSYAASLGFRPSCCDCPACHYPSRRDIVEETALQFFRGCLWEFEIPGVPQLLSNVDGCEADEEIRSLSAPGVESKKAHLPHDFSSFAVDFFLARLDKNALNSAAALFDRSVCLDEIGENRLLRGASLASPARVPLPALLQPGRQLSNHETLMIAALGPFWGALGLEPKARSQAYALQKRLFDLTIDDKWSHVMPLLRKYYWRNHATEQTRKKLALRFIPCSSCCISRT